MSKKLAAAVLLFLLILSAGCVAEKAAEAGDTVSVYYTLSLDDGTTYESNVGKTPLEFVVGSGQMISGFDAAVAGMKVGETRTVRLAPADAYGEITDEMIQTMPMADLVKQTGAEPAEGDILRATVNTGNGYQSVYLKILTVDGDTVSLAVVGSPLAGEYLTFEITLASIA